MKIKKSSTSLQKQAGEEGEKVSEKLFQKLVDLYQKGSFSLGLEKRYNDILKRSYFMKKSFLKDIGLAFVIFFFISILSVVIFNYKKSGTPENMISALVIILILNFVNVILIVRIISTRPFFKYYQKENNLLTYDEYKENVEIINKFLLNFKKITGFISEGECLSSIEELIELLSIRRKKIAKTILIYEDSEFSKNTECEKMRMTLRRTDEVISIFSIKDIPRNRELFDEVKKALT